jgi:predicted MFS family arabinose efflux permease
MRIVILVGAGLSFVSAVLMTNFRDSWALGERSEAYRTVKPKPDTHVDRVKRVPQDADDAAKGESYPLLGNRGANKGASINVVPEMPMVAPGMESKASESSRPSFRLRMIPVLIASGDVVSGLASGMTVKFFSIFFIDAVGLNPIAVSLIWAAAPFVTASFVSAARVLTKRLGRMQVYIMFKMAGISMLVFMATFPRYWAVPYAIIPVYIFRTALMNSPRFVLKTIMMDYVPKANRGKWISFDLVFAVGWSGSAALGGYFVKRHGWTFTFLITATMQALALLPSFVLLAIVPKHESARTSAADAKQ